MKKLLLLSIICINSFAIVSTQDIGVVQEIAQDKVTMGSYVASVSSTMNKISQTMDAANQLKNLKGLQGISGAGKTLCQLCTKSEQDQLQNYVSTINDDLCSQFSNAYHNLTGITNAASSLSDIMRLLATNPKAAMMSLQQATIAAQQTTNSTLAQMQLMQAQSMQKQLAEEKLRQKTAQEMTDNLSKLGNM
jgi:hypothetical protein